MKRRWNRTLQRTSGSPGWKSFVGLVRLCLALVVWSVWAADAPAQFFQTQTSEGITVEGTGEVRTVPDVVEINLKLNARAELTDDAVVKHRDSRKRTLETFEGLKLENLKLDERELSLRPGNQQEMWQMMMNGMPAAQNKRAQIEVGSTLRARLSNVNKLSTEELMSTIGKLLDAAQDSGAGMGLSDAEMMQMRYYGGYNRQSSLVKFIVTNVGEVREKAYELAVADARKRAERLARLNGVKLGAVSSVDEMEVGSGRQNPYVYYGGPVEEQPDEKNELVAETMSGGRMTIRLRIRFAIAPSTARAAVAPADAPMPVVAAQGESP